MTRTNPSFVRASASIALATLLPSAQSGTLVTRANEAFTRANKSKTLVSEMPCCSADKRGHRSTTPRNSNKTSQRRFPRENFPEDPAGIAELGSAGDRLPCSFARHINGWLDDTGALANRIESLRRSLSCTQHIAGNNSQDQNRRCS